MTKKGIGWTNVAWSLVFALITMWIAYGDVDPRGFLVFLAYLVVAEIFLLFRWRLSLPCAICGFDPALYLRDPKAAAERVRIEVKKAQDGHDWRSLRAHPWSLLPVRRKAKESPVGSVGKRTLHRTI